MITHEEYLKYKALVDEYEQAEDEMNDDFDDDPFEECDMCGRNPCVCDFVMNCTCGAWTKTGAHVADCICGAG